MPLLTIERVTALPVPITPSTMYIVRSNDAGLVELYFTSDDGMDLRRTISKADIQAMIDAHIPDTSNLLSSVKIVQDIVARDSLSLTSSGFALVLDATADPTVTQGAALYVFDAGVIPQQWYKVSEYESMDIQLLWNNIQGKPQSAVASIDDAVYQRHTHNNLSVLDALSADSDGNLMFNGSYPKIPLAAVEW